MPSPFARPARPLPVAATRRGRPAAIDLAAGAIVAAGLLLVLGACAAPAPSAAAAKALVTVAKPLGSRQCETGGPSPASVLAPLRDTGIPVHAAGCGHDGRMRPAVCGASDGRLALADIPDDRLAGARALGFRPLSDWPDARRIDCAPADPGERKPAGPVVQ
jgi:hypothetical protein